MADLKRRYSDHLKKTSEHDLLIKLHLKFDSMCSMQKDLKADLKEYKEKIDTRCESRSDHCGKMFEARIPSSTFWKVFSVIVLVLIAIGGTVSYNSITSAKNTVLIMSIDDGIKN